MAGSARDLGGASGTSWATAGILLLATAVIADVTYASEATSTGVGVAFAASVCIVLPGVRNGVAKSRVCLKIPAVARASEFCAARGAERRAMP